MFAAITTVVDCIIHLIRLSRTGLSFLRIVRKRKSLLHTIQIGGEHNCSYCWRCCSSHCHCC